VRHRWPLSIPVLGKEEGGFARILPPEEFSSSGTLNVFAPDMEHEDADHTGVPAAGFTALVSLYTPVRRCFWRE